MNWERRTRWFSFGITTEAAGVLTLDWMSSSWEVSIHILPRQRFRYWGFFEDWHDGPLYMVGMGPVFLVCVSQYGEFSRS
jgi:hypothetical protein